LNEYKNLELAKTAMLPIEKTLNNISQRTSDRLLQEAFEAVLPKRNPSATSVVDILPQGSQSTQSEEQLIGNISTPIEKGTEIPLDRCIIIPLTEPNWSKKEKSYDKALKTGAAFLNQRNKNKMAWSEQVQKIRKNCQSSEQRNAIRTRKEEGPENEIHLSGGSVNLEHVCLKYSIEFFSYTQTGPLKCNLVKNPSNQPIIRLLVQERKTPNGEKYQHYDLLILTDDL
jgi:hypothetical protein